MMEVSMLRVWHWARIVDHDGKDHTYLCFLASPEAAHGMRNVKVATIHTSFAGVNVIGFFIKFYLDILVMENF